MIEIKILGTGCANCKTTQKLVEHTLADKGIQARIEKIEDIPSIMRYGVMGTPGVVVDGKLMHSGSVPTRTQIEAWIADAPLD